MCFYTIYLVIFACFDLIGNTKNDMITYDAIKMTKIGEKMQIHTKLPGENIKDIAKKYSVSEDSIRHTNGITEGEAADGEQLLILFPTRSYTVKYGDTVDRIALRFGIKKRDIYSLNPWLTDSELRIGESIALKYDERRGGMAVANGYYYKGCDERSLKMAMPYLTYVTFAEGVADESGIHRTTDFSSTVKHVKDERKIPLVRIYDRYPMRYKTGKDMNRLAEEMIRLALESGYKGIVLDACPLSDSAEEFSSFLMILRKLMIGCDLILITEINENSPLEFSEYADGSVIYYPKFAVDTPPSFAEGERRILSDLACRGESAKIFVDLPTIAKRGCEFLPTADLIKAMRKNSGCIENNKSTLLSHTVDRKQGEYEFTSLEGIKAIMDLVGEFDYMGICFDIMRTPLSHLMLYDATFKTAYTTYVSSREGCSRADGE